MKKIRLSLLVAVAFTGYMVSAQTVDQGKKFLYYERYKSAKETFDKIIAANPNNIDAVYWLGQTLMNDPDLKDSVAAKALYQKALQTNGSAPMLLAGIGGIELREGKDAEARAHFETALSLTKSKDINVLNAVGAANANLNIKGGDPAYAIEKLNLATQIKNFSNPDTYLILGDAYRKLIDGSNAVLSYQKALSVDPKSAAAEFRIGKVYLTQNNKEYFLPAFEKAIQLDPAYAPAFYALFDYWFYRDIDKAADYFDKYLAVSDKTPENEYNRVSIIWGRKKYPEAIAAAQQDLNSLGANATPKYYKLIAYAYNDEGDSTNAKNFLDQYFAKQKPENIISKDYSFRAQVLSKFPGNDSLAALNYQYAIDADTMYDNKLTLLKEAADVSKKSGNKKANALFLGKLYNIKKDPSQTDLYNWGLANYQAGDYKASDSIFCGSYESKFPTEIFGYLWCARSKRAQDDSTNSGGLAVDSYEKLAQQGRSLDSVKFKNQIVESYFYLASYYNDIKKDKATAIANLEKILQVDPTNTSVPPIIAQLKKPAKQPAQKPKPGAKAGK